MENVKAIAWSRERTIATVQFVALLGIATIAPLFHSQPITGPIVNATLFLAVAYLGTQTALLVGLLPSVIALSVGLLPAVLAPMVPFIMLGNVLMILVFGYLKQTNFWTGMVTASVLKFAFLYGTSYLVIDLLLKKEIASTVAAMMSWPQLWTALAGGVIAFVVLRFTKKSK